MQFWYINLAVASFLASLCHASPTTPSQTFDVVPRQASASGNASTSSFKFYGWNGCSDPQRTSILAAWDSLLDIADAVKGNVEFNGQVRDIYKPELNYAHMISIG